MIESCTLKIVIELCTLKTVIGLCTLKNVIESCTLKTVIESCTLKTKTRLCTGFASSGMSLLGVLTGIGVSVLSGQLSVSFGCCVPSLGIRVMCLSSLG